MQALVDWHRIDTVLLDMDGTLLDLYYDNQFWLHHLPAVYARARGLGAEAARDELVLRFGREQGRLNWYNVDFWSRELGLDVAGHKKDIAHLIRPRPGAFTFLDAVTGSGRRAWRTFPGAWLPCAPSPRCPRRPRWPQPTSAWATS